MSQSAAPLSLPDRFAAIVTPPLPLRTAEFVLEPLGPIHNERDHPAWMGSIEHIRQTPGFIPDGSRADAWPFPMTLEMNMGDMEMHAGEFADGVAYAYSILDPSGVDVIGCVYVDPDGNDTTNAHVRSWVITAKASLDDVVAASIDDWLRTDWNLSSIRWPGRNIALG